MPHVSALDDYLPCPALSRWLVARLDGLAVRHTIVPGAPRSLRRIVSQWPALDRLDGLDGLDALVIAGSLRRASPLELVSTLPASTVLVEIAGVGGMRVGERLFGLPARAAIRRLTGRRLTSWLDAGLADIEQWLTTEPPDTVVTLGVCR